MRIRLALVALAFLVPGTASAQLGACGAPATGDDGWQTAAPADTGLDPAILCGIGPLFERWKDSDIHAVLVVRHGRLAYEHYFTGLDEQFGHSLGVVAYDATMKHDLRSISKSVTALVLGIAVGKGWIGDVDQPVLAQLPDYADLRTPAKDSITLRHLLTMSQGLAWDEDLPYSNPENSEVQMDFAPDPVRYALSRPVVFPPGLAFNYSGGSAAIIAALLKRATAVAWKSSHGRELFEPLGITDVEWMGARPGEPFAASGLRMRPRDLAKLGQLVLDKGAWHGSQIVPVEWMAAATAPQINGQGIYFYGYQFWLGRSLVKGREIDWAAGIGLGGQRLFIVPALDLVVVVTAGLYTSPMQSWVPLVILNRFALPAAGN